MNRREFLVAAGALCAGAAAVSVVKRGASRVEFDYLDVYFNVYCRNRRNEWVMVPADVEGQRNGAC